MKILFVPDFCAKRVTDITPDFLKSRGIKAAILDLDGNLAGYQHEEAAPEVVAWVANLLTEGIKLCIVSNPGPKSTLTQIASQLRLAAFRGIVPKPLPKAFREARHFLGVPTSEMVMIGDQLLTDVLGANFLGMKTIWVDPIPGAKEGWITRKINRRIEFLYRQFGRQYPSLLRYIVS